MANWRVWLPGVAFATALATGAYLLAKTPFFKDTLHIGALLLVILIGMAWRSALPIHASFWPGIALAQKPILRWAVAGLGFKLSLQELGQVGLPALAVVTICTVGCLLFAWWLALRMGVPQRLAILLGTGTAVCGASAIVAADSVTQSEEGHVPCALGVITLLGTLGIVLYPPIGHALGLSDFTFGLWNGASLHEVAQVVAAANGFSPGAEAASTVVKLARICLLAPIVFGIAWYLRRQGAKVGQAHVQPVPWFLVVFLVVVAFNSIGVLPKSTVSLINEVVLWLLCVGMAGVGLNSGFQDVRRAGWTPVWAALLAWVVLSGASLGLAVLVPPP